MCCRCGEDNIYLDVVNVAQEERRRLNINLRRSEMADNALIQHSSLLKALYGFSLHGVLVPDETPPSGENCNLLGRRNTLFMSEAEKTSAYQPRGHTIPCISR